MMKTIIVTLLALFSVSLNASTIYKCVGKNGKINYQDSPCESEQKETKVSETKANNSAVNNQSNVSTKTKKNRKQSSITVDNIEFASDGLQLIRKTGFGPYNLTELKAKLLSGEKLDIKKTYPGTPYNPEESHLLRVVVNDSFAMLEYWSEGKNYEVYTNPQKEIKNDKRDGEYSLNFDLTKEKVNKKAISIGLKDKGRAAKTKGGGTHDLNWKWHQDGFKCELSVSAVSYATPHHLFYKCVMFKK